MSATDNELWAESGQVCICNPLVSPKTLKSVSVTPKKDSDIVYWRVPNPPGANPLVAERAPWRSSQSCVTGGQQPIVEIPTDSCHFFCTPGNLCATPIVTRGEGSFCHQGVSTRGVRHSPGLSRSIIVLQSIVFWTHSCEHACLGESRFRASGQRSEKIAKKSILASPGK